MKRNNLPVCRPTGSHFICLEPRSNRSQYKTNGVLVLSKSSVNQQLVYDVINSPTNSRGYAERGQKEVDQKKNMRNTSRYTLLSCMVTRGVFRRSHTRGEGGPVSKLIWAPCRKIEECRPYGLTPPPPRQFSKMQMGRSGPQSLFLGLLIFCS